MTAGHVISNAQIGKEQDRQEVPDLVWHFSAGSSWSNLNGKGVTVRG